MVKAFIKSSPVNYLIAFLMLIVSRIDDWQVASNSTELSEFMGKLGVTHFSISPTSLQILLIFIIYIQAIWVSRIVHNFNLLSRPSDLPLLMYILCMNLLSQFQGFQKVLISNFIHLWLINKLFKLYKEQDVQSGLLDVGIILFIGVYFYTPFIVFLLLCLIPIAIFRTFNWREWGSVFIGFFALFIPVLSLRYYLGYSVLTPEMTELTQIFSRQTRSITPISLIEWISLSIFFCGFLISIAKFLDNLYRSSVFVRKTFQILFLFILIIVLTLFFNHPNNLSYLILAIPPIAIWLSYGIILSKRLWVLESIYILCYVIPILHHLYF